MGIRVLNDDDLSMAALYDSVSGFAFGPTFTDETVPGLPADEAAALFVVWCDYKDPRVMVDRELSAAVDAWRLMRGVDIQALVREVSS